MSDFKIYFRSSPTSSMEYLMYDFFISVSNSFALMKSKQDYLNLHTILYSFFSIFKNGSLGRYKIEDIEQTLETLKNGSITNDNLIKLIYAFFEIAYENGLSVDYRMNTNFETPNASDILIVKYFKTIVNSIIEGNTNGNYETAMRYIIVFWGSIRFKFENKEDMDNIVRQNITYDNVRKAFDMIIRKASEVGILLEKEQVFDYE